MHKKSLIIYTVLFFSAINCFSQKSINVSVPCRKKYSITQLNINYRKVYLDSLVLTRKSRQILTEKESQSANIFDSLSEQMMLNKIRFIVYDNKGRLFEKCGGNREFLVGEYQRFRKSGELNVEGGFNMNGQKNGKWIAYRRNKKIKWIKYFEDDILIR